MISYRKRNLVALLLLAHGNEVAHAFSPSRHPNVPMATTSMNLAVGPAVATEGVQERQSGKQTIATPEPLEALSVDEAKHALIELLPRMTGKDEEYRAVESYVNLLEDKYSPVQTLGFLNLAMAGEWQLLFSTNLAGRPNRNLRLRELVQKVETDGFKGRLINFAQWEYAEEDTFDAFGKFSVNCSYSINQGSRMVVDLNDHELRPAKGSTIPKNVPGLVGLLHRALPREIFDPNGHTIDTTYLDADLRIVRLNGPNYEGVRNIFMRKGSFEIKPV